MKELGEKAINKYQKYISPMFYAKGIRCRYYPTCSEYTKQAIQKYGLVIGTFKGCGRIMRCNPFSKGGYDPVK